MGKPDAHDKNLWHFSSESVTEGHPDKVADAIADSVLDAALTIDPFARMACEVLVTTNTVIVAGERAVNGDFDLEPLVRQAVAEIGYRDGLDPGFDAETFDLTVLMHDQSGDISSGVSNSLERRKGIASDSFDDLGAGDQGLMFGFACDETEELMPLPIQLAHRLAERLALVRRVGELPYLRPDGKTQVSVAYEGQEPKSVSTILISAQHAEGIDQQRLESDLSAVVVKPILTEWMDQDEVDLLVNPSGQFVVGGPAGDTGLTGRKIIVDTYGGYARHGGGAFSGKDSTKVDRSAAYAARHAAKNVVAAGLAARCELQLAYAIGQARPFSILVNTFGTGEVDDRDLEAVVSEYFDFRPAAIIERLGLRRPIFRETAAYGHFGRPGFPWEETGAAADLASQF